MPRFRQNFDGVPLWNAAYDAHAFTKERIRERNYILECQLGQLHQRKLQIIEQAAAKPLCKARTTGQEKRSDLEASEHLATLFKQMPIGCVELKPSL